MKSQTPLLIFLSCYFVFAFITYRQYGITFDERDVYLRGKLLYIMVRGHDKVLQKDFVTPKIGNEMVYYNNTYPALLYQFNNKENFERYHLLNFLFASLIFLFLYEVLLVETKKPYFAIIGPLFLTLTPRFFGDIPANPKDIPFAVLYFISLAFIYLSNKWNNKLRIVILGVSFGLTQANRIVGYSIYPIYFLFRLLELKNVKNSNNKSLLISILIEMIIIFAIGFGIHILSIPYLTIDPLNHFLDLLKNSSNFSWSNDLLLWGKTYSAQLKPWPYIPTWFLITTPLFIYFSLVGGLYFKDKKSKLVKLILISLFINVLILIIIRPVIYDGIRHLLFILPQIIVLASLFFVRLVEHNTKISKILIAVVLVGLLLVLINYMKLHPYEYIYFNEAMRGIKGADKKFELDYWGASNKEATEWVNANIATSNSNKIHLAVCGTSFTIAYYINKNVILASDIKNSDYVVCWDRFGDNKKIDGMLIHSIKRDGVSLVGIYKINK